MALALNRKFLVSSFGLAAIIILISTAIFFRVVIISDIPAATFLEILGWQALSWLPWALLIAFASLDFGKKVREAIPRWTAPAHIVGAIIIATLSTLWFKFISENLSPFLHLEGTRYGVFPWFFIFWFFFGLFLYWGCVSFFGMASLGSGQAGKPSEPRLVVKTGKVSEVIKPKDVHWIEAQDYYSVLHLADRQSWIKMTMKELEETLDASTFVRIHRSTIINVNHLNQIKTEAAGKYSAIMKDGKIRPISRAGWRDLKKVLKTTK